MALIKLSRNMQLALFLGGAVLILHFYNQLLYKPLHSRISLLQLDQLNFEAQIPDQEIEQSDLAALEERYHKRYQEFEEFQDSVKKLEADLPSRNDMSKLLEELTKSLEGTGAKFVSVEPTFHKAEEGESFDSIEIQMYFQADFQGLISYLENLETSETILGIQGVELLTEEDSSTPYVTVYFSTYISDYVRKEDLSEKAPAVFETTKAGVIVKAMPSAEPFAADSRPYDQTLPGEHKLTMVVWRGGKAVALIDGKVMKEGSTLDSRKLTLIEEDGVWFSENGLQYYLGLET
jgi:Tfp pilus assembly protein PilO